MRFFTKMEKFEIEYSMKNIPIPSQRQYKIQLISKAEKLIQRMRWKTLEFLGKLSSDNNNNQTFGFPSTKCVPPANELADFEKDMMLMVKNIQFRKISNNFQQKLKDDIRDIKSINKVFVPADKSRNIYKLENEQYSKLLRENVTKTYKKSNFNKVRNTNNKAKKITENLPVADRIDKLQ